MKAILIAEKPSLMREIQATYREHRNEIPFEIDFLTQTGHLLGLKKPDEIDKEKYGTWRIENFPIDVPYQYKINPGKGELLHKIRNAVRSGAYDFVIHAGDPDQEGELLVNLVLNHVGNRLPVKRFWVNAQTHGEILGGLLHLKDDSEYAGFYKAALVRQHEDYQFGMNLTGIITLKLKELYKFGRVKAAIVKIVVDRELAIRNFVEKSTWKRAFTYDGCEFVNEKIFDTEEETIAALPQVNFSTITAIKDEVKSYKAPKLYKLSTLQTDAHKKLGYSAAQTLELLQHLYEAQIVTYPRTSCEYISGAVELENIIRAVAPVLGYSFDDFSDKIPFVRKDTSYVNNKAISTEGHTAILPTGAGNLGSVGLRERALYELIARRFLAIFSNPKKIRSFAVTAIPENNDKLGEYVYKESSDVDAGYELILNPGYELKNGRNMAFKKGQELRPVEFHTKECISRPPAKFNEGTLIRFLDEIEFKDEKGNKIVYSIGTPATRANIIKECIECGYFVVEKGIYASTPKAERLIAELGDISLFDIETSGRWEAMLEQIRCGEVDASVVEDRLLRECHAVVEDIKKRNIEKSALPKNAGNSPVLGKCPNCGADVSSGKYGAYCTGKCGMQVSKAMGKTLSDAQVKSLLAGKKTLVKGLTSKTGKKYDAYLTPVGTEPFSYKGQDGAVRNMVGFKFHMDFK